MKKLLNTLFITTENAYLSLNGENVVVSKEQVEIARFPLHTLSGIVCFSYSGASPALIGACAKKNICLSFHTPRGKFLARTSSLENGNVLLRRKQYRIADDEFQSCLIARNMILAKVYNEKWVLERAIRDHPDRVPVCALKDVSVNLQNLLPKIN